MKLRGIPLKSMRLKDGKLEPVKKRRSVSDAIRAKKSKKTRVVKCRVTN